MMKNGVVLVRFDTAVGINEVIQGGIYIFDNKLFIIKAWTPDVEFSRDGIVHYSYLDKTARTRFQVLESERIK